MTSESTEAVDNPYPGYHVFTDIFGALGAPFEAKEVKTRKETSKKTGQSFEFSYVTSRVVMNRLDNVLGPTNWWDEYTPGQNGVMCRLTIRLPDGTLMTKVDAGGYAGMDDGGDDEKSGFSDALKRAAVKFGIGRYLYRDGVPYFVTALVANEQPRDQSRYGNQGASRPAQGGNQPRQAQGRGQGQGNSNGNSQSRGSLPQTGRAMFAWTKDRSREYEVDLLAYLNQWAKLQEFPSRMVDWSEQEVALAVKEASRKLQSLAPSDSYEEALSN